MRQIVTQDQAYLKAWLSRMLLQKFDDTATFIGQEKDGNLVAVIGFTNFIENACAMHIASVGENWMSRDLLWACFDYPFNKLKKKVILATLNAENEEAVRLNRHLGFKEEVVIKDAHEDGDLMIMTMRSEDCKWLKIRTSLNKGE